MTYDATAQKLGIKILGTVESNLNYAAINYNDPITVGVVQWFGVRAAALLGRMRDDNPSAWFGVASSLANQLLTIPATDVYWNTRRLTQAEGDSLTGVLTRNQAIQNTQLIEDMEDYKAVAVSYGFDPDANTETVLYFFSMHHQSPASALDVVSGLDTNATLEQIHAATLAHPVLGQYGARYNTTYNLIDQANIDGVDPTPPPEPPAPVPVNSNAQLISVVGDQLMVKFKDQERIQAVPDGRGNWIPRKGRLPDPVPAPTQEAPPPDNGSWMLPLSGGASLTSGYGPRAFDGLASFHYGIDLANPAGSPGTVRAPCPLTITVAYNVGDPGANGTAGGYVKGHTADGKYTFNFYHMAAGTVSVNAGDTVDTGDTLGTEGATGNVSGQHLHFEAYAGNLTDPWPPPYGNPIDPLPILRAHGVNI